MRLFAFLRFEAINQQIFFQYLQLSSDEATICYQPTHFEAIKRSIFNDEAII
jgi:hypothetical protein